MSSRKRRAASSPKNTKQEPASFSSRRCHDYDDALLEEVASPMPCDVRDCFEMDQDRVFLQEASYPSYLEWGIWSILQRLGFSYGGGGYRHPALDGMRNVDHDDAIRSFLVQRGIPPNTYATLQGDDLEAFLMWVAFAHVPPVRNDQTRPQVPVPSDHEALLYLLSLGFQLDKTNNNRQTIIYRIINQEERQEFQSIHELRSFVRASDTETLMAGLIQSHQGPARKKRRTARKIEMPLTDNEFWALRLWAALSPELLPGEATQQQQLEDKMEQESTPQSSVPREDDTKKPAEEDDKSDHSAEETIDDREQPVAETPESEAQSKKKQANETSQQQQQPQQQHDQEQSHTEAATDTPPSVSAAAADNNNEMDISSSSPTRKPIDSSVAESTTIGKLNDKDEEQATDAPTTTTLNHPQEGSTMHNRQPLAAPAPDQEAAPADSSCIIL
ncbi:expressed unknown protein [Seminavis robusta]|uniref:Uncharacterized protein n=1 Tax=Seminavis robusta TaxID=568900 RepID=A0A9N8EXI0_9STRA|nr:expressed unknown protein [Seminavis robusta]|eukprot:Sro1901_g304350.1 n/a (445) ;mRNA; r:12604-13938